MKTDSPPRQRHRLTHLVFAIAFNVVIALVMFLLTPRFGSFLNVLMFSQCIGLSIYGSFVVTGYFVPARAAHHVGWWVAEGLVALPLGYAIGMSLGLALIGAPVRIDTVVELPSLVVAVLATALMIYFLRSRAQKAAEAAELARVQRLEAEARLKLLQTQIEPHMLFNTLANLRSLVTIDANAAQAMIDQLIVYLRATLTASRQTSVTLESEFAQLRAYLELMKVRMGRRLNYELTLGADCAAATIPPMLLQPLVENAIKHGLEPKVGGGELRVTARVAYDKVIIDIVDTGLGLGPEAPGAPTEGYGLTHVRERLQGIYGAAARLSMCANAPEGARVTVELPR